MNDDLKTRIKELKEELELLEHAENVKSTIVEEDE